MKLNYLFLLLLLYKTEALTTTLEITQNLQHPSFKVRDGDEIIFQRPFYFIASSSKPWDICYFGTDCYYVHLSESLVGSDCASISRNANGACYYKVSETTAKKYTNTLHEVNSANSSMGLISVTVTPLVKPRLELLFQDTSESFLELEEGEYKKIMCVTSEGYPQSALTLTLNSKVLKNNSVFPECLNTRNCRNTIYILYSGKVGDTEVGCIGIQRDSFGNSVVTTRILSLVIKEKNQEKNQGRKNVLEISLGVSLTLLIFILLALCLYLIFLTKKCRKWKEKMRKTNKRPYIIYTERFSKEKSETENSKWIGIRDSLTVYSYEGNGTSISRSSSLSSLFSESSHEDDLDFEELELLTIHNESWV